MIVPTSAPGRSLGHLLDSLRAQTREHDVIVVENGPRAQASAVAARFPDVQVVSLPENMGFGPAVNRGVAASGARTVVLVNDDAVCEPEFVARLAAALDPPNGVVMAAGVLLDQQDPRTIDSAGILFDRTLFAVDYLQGQPVAALEHAADPCGPTGGAAAFDVDAFEAVGGFDESFFAYLEDVDLVARLIAVGGRCRLAAGARAVHRHSATLGSRSRRKNELMGWGRGYTIAKYRLHRRPSLFARAALAELVIAAGQLAIDRTVVSFGARAAGFRRGLRVPEEPLPPVPEGAPQITLLSALRYRLRRRR